LRSLAEARASVEDFDPNCILKHIMQVLSKRNLFVAAAGNDSTDGRKDPSDPAAYASALAAAAVTKDGRPADYSNRAITLRGEPSSILQGVATFGGAPQAGAGIRGLYGTAPFPMPVFPQGAWSTSGWAEWAGTSFATAVVSGFAASLAATGTPVSDLRARLQQIVATAPADHDLNCQVLRATQQ
jgi:hypothetical protein